MIYTISSGLFIETRSINISDKYCDNSHPPSLEYTIMIRITLPITKKIIVSYNKTGLIQVVKTMTGNNKINININFLSNFSRSPFNIEVLCIC
jgi:hypothetical protein